MLLDLLFAGIGGQGILSMGTLLAQAAVVEGREVTWTPSYKGVMRGNDSTCMVSISDCPILSPAVSSYDVVIALSPGMLKLFESKVKKDGILIWESTNIKVPPTRKDIRCYGIPAYENATSVLKNVRVMNMIIIGVLLKVSPIVKKESIFAELESTLPARHHHLLSLNERAIELGMLLSA